MKTNALRFLLATICLAMLTFNSKAQTLWGTLPDAFYHSSTSGDYGEVFKDTFVGYEAGRDIFISPDNTLYSFTDNKTIYRFRAGDLLPTIVFRSDSIALYVHLIDFEDGYIYCTGTIPSGPMIFRLNLDGTGFTILRSNDGAGGYGGLIKDNDKFFGFRSNGVFTMNLDGSGYHLIRTITDPSEILTKLAVHSETDLYAISRFGGLCGRGAMFSLTKDGSTLTKLIEFRGSDDCGIPPPDEEAPIPEFVEVPNFEIAASEEPVGLMKDPGDDDWFIITYGTSNSEDGYGALYMYGQDGLTLLRGFSYNHGNPNGTMAMNSTGQLYGLCGVLDDFGGKIFKYDFTGGGFSIVFDFDYDDIGSIVTTFALAPDGRLYGQAERTTFNYMQAGSIFSLNQNGSDPKQLFYFKSSLGPREMAYGNGSLVGVFSRGGEQEYGSYNPTVFTYSQAGVNTIYDFGDESNNDEADSAQLTVGSDGYAYLLVHRYNYMLKIKLDGSTSQKTSLPSFLTSAPLAETSSGLFGSSYFDDTHPGGFLYKVNSGFGGITPIYSFVQSTGHKPRGKLTEGSDNFLYGMTSAGGSSNLGVIYKVQANGTGYSVIHHFAGADGATPYGGLLRDGDFFFGLSSAGGANSKGTLFKIKYDGTGFSKLFDFGGASGDNPNGDLVEDGDGYLYGVTRTGGQQNKGVLFKSDKTGNLSVLKNFDRSPRKEHVTFVNQPVGETSFLVSPPDAEAGVSLSPEIKFHTAKYAVLYTLELSTNPAFTGTLITKTINGTIGQIDGLSYATTYYARVKVDATPGYGAVTSFTTRSANGAETIITYPHNNDTLPGSLTEIRAGLVEGATTYTFKVSLLAIYTGETSELETTINQNVFAPFQMQPSTRYTVQAKTNTNPNYGPSVTFYSSPASPYVLSPANGETSVSLTPLVTVDFIFRAKIYTVELNTSSDFTGTSFVKTSTVDFERSFRFTGLTPLTTYYVRAKVDLTPEWGPTQSFTTGATVFITQPKNNETRVSATPVFKITPIPGATQYFLELSRTSDFSIIDYQLNESDATIALSGLKYLTVYYARARTNLSPAYGPTISFTTHEPERYSFVSNPVNGATNIGTVNVKITANIVFGATNYTIELNTSPDFTGTSIVRSSAVPNQRTIIFPNLAPSTKYYNRTRTNLPSGWGPVRSFTTRSVGAPPPLVEEVTEVLVYPNPFERTFTVETSNDTGDGVTALVLLDPAGRELYKIETSDRSVELGDELPQGVYILRLTNNNKTLIKRVIKK